MDPQHIEFLVKEGTAGSSRTVTVVGRVGDRPIRVDDTFDSLCLYGQRKYPEEMGDEPVLKDSKPVCLRVACIHAYDRSLDVLSQGMTGSLALEGEGSGLVAPGWVLCRRNGEVSL